MRSELPATFPRPLIIKFDGGDADFHSVDMRALGQSLVGLDRIISDGVIFFMEQRPPKRGERAALIVKAQEPIIGSHEIWAFLQEKKELLALGYKLFTDSGADIVWDWVSAVLGFFGGDKKTSEVHLEAFLQAQRDQLAARDKSEDRLVAEIAASREQAWNLILKQSANAISATTPIGPSVHQLTLLSGEHRTAIDEPMAEAIRAKGEIEVGSLQEFVLKADGWIYHSKILSVHHPQIPGRFISAKVRDPLADDEPNVYADAGRDRETIRVLAKASYREGVIENIYIMDFKGRTAAAA